MNPIFSTSKVVASPRGPEATPRMYVKPKPTQKKLRGTTEWAGTASAVVRADRADPRMKVKGYDASCKGTDKTTDAAVLSRIKEVLAEASCYVRVAKIKKEDQVNMTWNTLSVYVKEDKIETANPEHGSPDLFFVDRDLCSEEKLWGKVETEDGVVAAVNAPTEEEVTLLVAAYRVRDLKIRKRALKKAKELHDSKD